jgi:hypothetical protein
VRLEGLGKLRKIIHLIGSRTHDLPACKIVPCKERMSLNSRCRDKVGKRWKYDTVRVHAEFCIVEMRLMRARRLAGRDPSWQAVSICVHAQLFWCAI